MRPTTEWTAPLGAVLSNRYAPPTRRSSWIPVSVMPSGPHHLRKISGLVNASNTKARGAANTRLTEVLYGAVKRLEFDGSAFHERPYVKPDHVG